MKTWTAKSTGRSVTLKSVPARYVVEIAQKPDLRDPDPPTYTVTAAGGVEMTFPHDETTLQTDEDRAAWAEYERQCEVQELRRRLETARFLYYSVVTDEPEPVEKWRFEFALWGLEPPDPGDKIGFKVRWIEEEICGGDTEDSASLLLQCYTLSGMNQEMLRQIESFFRNALEGSGSGRPNRKPNPSGATQGEK